MGSESLIANVGETSQVVNITLKKPSLSYLDEFISLTCAPDMLIRKLFPNAKEITESMGMFQAVVRVAKSENTKDERVKLFVIGDGNTPRTAAMFAFRTSWFCWSIDPALKNYQQRIEKPIRGLNTSPYKFEELEYGHLAYIKAAIKEPGRKILVLPHAHISHSVLEEVFDENTLVVTMPCCYPFKEQQETWHGRKPDIIYHDWRIHSPEREIRIWNKIC